GSEGALALHRVATGDPPPDGVVHGGRQLRPQRLGPVRADGGVTATRPPDAGQQRRGRAGRSPPILQSALKGRPGRPACPAWPTRRRPLCRARSACRSPLEQTQRPANGKAPGPRRAAELLGPKTATLRGSNRREIVHPTRSIKQFLPWQERASDLRSGGLEP